MGWKIDKTLTKERRGWLELIAAATHDKPQPRSGACLRNASGAFIETAKPAAPRDERMLYAQNMKLNTLQDLYVHGLKDLYSAETQLVEALPKMAEAATNEELKAGFEEHLEQTKGHVLRLEEIAESCGCNLGGHKCQAMEGLIEEGSELISEDAEDSVRDAGLIGSAQRVEHYEAVKKVEVLVN